MLAFSQSNIPSLYSSISAFDTAPQRWSSLELLKLICLTTRSLGVCGGAPPRRSFVLGSLLAEKRGSHPAGFAHSLSC